jgi:hypothetical protein
MLRNKNLIASLIMVMISLNAISQPIYQIKRNDASILFFDKNLSEYMPHIVTTYNRGMLLHKQIWEDDTSSFKYKMKTPMMYITDWEDDGNAGVSAIPFTIINIGMAPLNYSFFTSPSIERYTHLFNHELTHVVMADKYNKNDLFWRKLFGGKVSAESLHPISALWSYLTTPRWYSPRWYHEGIACFLETWLGGGVGRALGGYDEMYFRSMIKENNKIFSVIGLETEGTTQDFQLGTNSYLYGTRFVNYLAYRHGIDSLINFYNRTSSSRKFYGTQFKKVYGTSLKNEWESWKTLENEHQKKNLAEIGKYPLTKTEPLTNRALGSVSPPLLDNKRGVIYSAINHPGSLAKIVSIEIKSGKSRQLMLVNGPMMYQTSYIAFDSNHDLLYATSNNAGIRGMLVYDLNKHKIVKKKKFTRVSDIVYNNINDRLYGIFTNSGVSHIIYFDNSIESMKVIYSIPFGQSISNLAVSNNGKWLSATLFCEQGEQKLIRFNIAELENANFKYEELLTTEDYNLTHFRFSQNDSLLNGSSYYTGVSNLWQLNLNTKEFKLLSNTATGLFAPIQIAKDSLIALQFERDGMRPVKLGIGVLEDANAIEFLGEKAYKRNPQLAHISEIADSSRLKIEFKEVYNKIERYRPFKELNFICAYPDITGFSDTSSFNNVTPVIGYRFILQDLMGLNRLNLHIGVSPWSNNKWKDRFHASLNWNYWGWKLSAYYNGTNFYDLFGPVLTSRTGYKIGIKYKFKNTIIKPYEWEWGAGLATYGMMDKLPLFQNISVDSGINSMQIATANIGFSKLRTSLGGVMPEQGYILKMMGYNYLTGGKLSPTLIFQADGGFLLPFSRNTSLWLRTATGSSFGNMDSTLGNEYFGGFQNNYIDHRDSYHYREVNSMPGAKIDQIQAHTFSKITGELNLKPIRFNNFGLLGLYPTYTQISLFSSNLLANPWGNGQFHNYINVGAQMNIEVVFFSYLKTTFSFGYAHIWETSNSVGNKLSRGEWMISLKLL